jgi:hypothetical protein
MPGQIQDSARPSCNVAGAGAARPPTWPPLATAVRYVAGMNSHALSRKLGTTAAVAALGAAALGGGAATGASNPVKITEFRADGVHIGDTHKDLRNRNKVGPLRGGCNLGGSNTRSARLLSPLKGSVDFTLTNPRKVTNITITGGGEARGVGIGATIKEIKAKFPHAKVDHSTEHTFQITLVRAGHHGKIKFGVSTKTHKTTLIGVPFIAFCE